MTINPTKEMIETVARAIAFRRGEFMEDCLDDAKTAFAAVMQLREAAIIPTQFSSVTNMEVVDCLNRIWVLAEKAFSSPGTGQHNTAIMGECIEMLAKLRNTTLLQGDQRKEVRELVGKARSASRYLHAMAEDDVSNLADSIVAEELDQALRPFTPTNEAENGF